VQPHGLQSEHDRPLCRVAEDRCGSPDRHEPTYKFGHSNDKQCSQHVVADDEHVDAIPASRAATTVEVVPEEPQHGGIHFGRFARVGATLGNHGSFTVNDESRSGCEQVDEVVKLDPRRCKSAPPFSLENDDCERSVSDDLYCTDDEECFGYMTPPRVSCPVYHMESPVPIQSHLMAAVEVADRGKTHFTLGALDSVLPIVEAFPREFASVAVQTVCSGEVDSTQTESIDVGQRASNAESQTDNATSCEFEETTAYEPSRFGIDEVALPSDDHFEVESQALIDILLEVQPSLMNRRDVKSLECAVRQCISVGALLSDILTIVTSNRVSGSSSSQQLVAGVAEQQQQQCVQQQSRQQSAKRRCPPSQARRREGRARERRERGRENERVLERLI